MRPDVDFEVSAFSVMHRILHQNDCIGSKMGHLETFDIGKGSSRPVSARMYLERVRAHLYLLVQFPKSGKLRQRAPATEILAPLRSAMPSSLEIQPEINQTMCKRNWINCVGSCETVGQETEGSLFRLTGPRAPRVRQNVEKVPDQRGQAFSSDPGRWRVSCFGTWGIQLLTLHSEFIECH